MVQLLFRVQSLSVGKYYTTTEPDFIEIITKIPNAVFVHTEQKKFHNALLFSMLITV